MMPKVSVIIPVYRVETYIERCARSLFEQTLAEMEFIFVDDCGEDNSISILESVATEYPDCQVRIIKQSCNQGVSAARDAGIAVAMGEYIGFCDSDDWVDTSMYEKLYKAAEQNAADIVGCGYNEIRPTGITQFVFDEDYDTLDQVISFEHFGGVYGTLCCKIIRRDFFLNEHQNLGKGLIMWEDSCTLIPLRLKSNRTIWLKECLYNYNVNENSMTTQFSLRKVKDSIEAVKRLECYFNDNGYSQQSQEMIGFLKINAKEVLLRFPTRENLTLWRNTFPEITSLIWKYPNWNSLLKLRAILISRLSFWMAFFILKLMRR